MNRMARYLVPIVAVAMLPACGLKQSFADADTAVERFHAALDQGQWQAIWNTTAPQFRQQTRQADFERILQAVHRKLGKVKQSKQVGWNANAGTSQSSVTVTMATDFERGSGTEQFIYVKAADQSLELAGYDIQSKEMMLD
jgi:hypothetical protein